ncbi:MAG: Gfo/Idh/MocA family oxidoreductase [Chloroflexi bacterium]|nr:Gfo/Idh/MocA family oxidoreductase [Chloroflexota bacterium]
MARVRLALIGCGGIARGAHLRGLSLLRGAGLDLADIVACCDVDRASAEAAAARTAELGLGAPRVFTSWETMLADRVADAVDICLPHGLHHVAGIAALEAGHHVFVEKPYTVTIKTGRALAEAADRAGRVLATGVCHRRMPGQRAVQWAVREGGLIGQPRLFFANYTQWRAPNPNPAPPLRWRMDRAMGGGAGVIDSGFHFLDTLRYFFGECEHVSAELGTPAGSAPGAILEAREETAVISFRFASGVIGTWGWSFAVPGHETRNIVLYGDEGSIEDTGYSDRYVIFHLFMHQGEVRRRDGVYLSMADLQARYRAALGPELLARVFPGGVTDHFAIELWDFLDAVQSGRPPEVDGWDGLRTLAIVEAIYESSLTGHTVRIADILSGATGSAWQGEIDRHWENAVAGVR